MQFRCCFISGLQKQKKRNEKEKKIWFFLCSYFAAGQLSSLHIKYNNSNSNNREFFFIRLIWMQSPPITTDTLSHSAQTIPNRMKLELALCISCNANFVFFSLSFTFWMWNYNAAVIRTKLKLKLKCTKMSMTEIQNTIHNMYFIMIKELF